MIIDAKMIRREGSHQVRVICLLKPARVGGFGNRNYVYFFVIR